MALQNEYENIYWPRGQHVMGIDEAGRGPLCGPVVVACCILPAGYSNDLINDSKKLSEKRRELLFKEIIRDAVFYKWRIVYPKEIDELNIYGATKKAMMELAVSSDIADAVLTDAMPFEGAVSMIKGDARSISIAAASILAKVLRDHIMYGLDILYPEYEYRKHKGYPTKRHLELIEEYGITKHYRMSYRPCAEAKIRKNDKWCL